MRFYVLSPEKPLFKPVWFSGRPTVRAFLSSLRSFRPYDVAFIVPPPRSERFFLLFGRFAGSSLGFRRCGSLFSVSCFGFKSDFFTFSGFFSNSSLRLRFLITHGFGLGGLVLYKAAYRNDLAQRGVHGLSVRKVRGHIGIKPHGLRLHKGGTVRVAAGFKGLRARAGTVPEARFAAVKAAEGLTIVKTAVAAESAFAALKAIAPEAFTAVGKTAAAVPAEAIAPVKTVTAETAAAVFEAVIGKTRTALAPETVAALGEAVTAESGLFIETVKCGMRFALHGMSSYQ